MKPRIAVLALLVGLLLMVGMIPVAEAGLAEPLVPRSAVAAPPTPQTPEPLATEITGRLTLIWGDPAPGVVADDALLYRLTDQAGRNYDLVIGEGSPVTPGDMLLLNGQRVNVGGHMAAAPARPGHIVTLYVTRLTAVPDDSVSVDVSGNQPWVSIMCKFADVEDEPRDLQYFQDMYSSSRPGLDHYWREVSYNAVNLQGSDAFGWFTLPHPRSYYVDDDAGETDLNALVIDCTAVADADVYFPDYVGINLMFNDWLGCCAWGGGSYLELDGVEQVWRTTWEPPWAYSDISVIYHETGHGFGMPHSSGDYGYVYDNVWDVMSADRYNCNDDHVDPVYGCLGQNTIAYHHDMLGWIPPEKLYLADLGSHSLTLEQIGQPQTNDYLMVKVPIEGSTNKFFTVEVRRLVGYDAKLPGNAVIIHEINPNWGSSAHVVDIDWNEDTSDEGAIWRVGEQFVDDSGEITISIDDATPTGFVISIENNSEPPNDPFEPNDVMENATAIAYGDELTGAYIQIPGDEDWYTFEANADDEIELYIDANSIGSSMEPYIYLYRWAGSELELVMDGYYGVDLDINTWLPDDGTYYLQVMEYNHGTDGGGEFFYDLALYLAPPWDYVLYPADEDAYVNQGAKTANYGSAAFMRVKNAAADMNAYVKFWIDPINPPAGQCLRNVDTWLRLFVKEPSSDGGDIFAVHSGWNEGTINWNNAPTIGGSALGSFGSVNDESYWYAWLDYEVSQGWNSFAIHNQLTNSVDYSSSEGGVLPMLEIDYQIETIHKPRSQFYASNYSGLAPFTTTFSHSASGCPTSYYWDFGDGETSTQESPTHTFTDPGWYWVQLTIANSYGSMTRGRWLHAAEPPTIVYVSPATIANIGGIPAQPSDILRYNKAANGWTMVYDGSNHGTTKNVSAFSFYGDDLLLVFSANQAIPGLGTATPRDVVRFTPDNPGIFPLGSGSWSWYLRGSWAGVGLTTTAEGIDALNEQWDDVSVSTTGAAALPTSPVLKLADEDVAYWDTWNLQWWLDFDGSNVTGLAAEDINGLWYDTETYEYYVTILGAFNLGGVVGDGKSIVRLTWDDGWQPSLFPWLAPGATFPSTIDAIELAR